MSQALVVLGDRTDHGGTVISAAPATNSASKGWARVGDMVSCPRCKGVFPISQGDNSLLDDGKPVAYHGCKTACGATLLSSQVPTTTAPSGGASSGVASSGVVTGGIPKGFGAIGGELVAGYTDEPVGQETGRFRGRFQVRDRLTGQPVANRAARVRSTGGQYVAGATDGEGFTPWIERDAAEALAFDLIESARP